MKRSLTLSPFTQADVAPIDRKTVYRGYAEVIKHHVRHKTYDGGWSEPMSRELFVSGDAVVVLPYDPIADAVVLVEQFRISAYERGIPPWLVECIAGRIDTGETAENVALREAQEEAGCSLTDLTKIGEMFASPGIFAEYVTFFCARTSVNTIGGIHGLDGEQEDIRALVVGFDDAMEALDDGRICTAPTFYCLNWLARHREKLQQKWK